MAIFTLSNANKLEMFAVYEAPTFANKYLPTESAGHTLADQWPTFIKVIHPDWKTILMKN